MSPRPVPAGRSWCLLLNNMAETTFSELLRGGFPIEPSPPDYSAWFADVKIAKAASVAPQKKARLRAKKDQLQRSRPSDSGHGMLPGAALFSESSGLDFGTLVHDCLAKIEWLPSDITGDAHELIEQFLKNRDVAAFFQRPSPEAVVWRERAMAVILDGKFVSAQMDRVVISATEILLVDFKTDQGEPAKIAERYAAQMHAYIRILEAWSGGRHRVRAFVATVRQPAVIEVFLP